MAKRLANVAEAPICSVALLGELPSLQRPPLLAAGSAGPHDDCPHGASGELDPKLACQLGDGSVALNRHQRHLRLERRVVLLPCPLHVLRYPRFLEAGLHLSHLSHFRGPAQGVTWQISELSPERIGDPNLAPQNSRVVMSVGYPEGEGPIPMLLSFKCTTLLHAKRSG